MKVGIVGLPNVGKSTLFNALTKSYAADAANFPFCTIDPNVGMVDVKDPRVTKLAEMSGAQKLIYAAITFVDIAGLVKGASKGEGMGNAFLSHIREVDAIVQVLRHFTESDINHVEGTVDPMRDMEIINTELIFSDLEQIEKRLAHAHKKAKGRDPEAVKEAALLQKFHNTLHEGRLLSTLRDELSDDDLLIVKSYNFLTLKPFVYALNVSQPELVNAEQIKKTYQDQLGAPVAIVCATMEYEMMEFADDEREEFLAELLEVEHTKHIPTLDDLIALAYDRVGLMYYFTTGEKETRARTIKKKSTAPEAAGAIHEDFTRGFIKAEVVSYDDLLAAGSRQGSKESGKLRLEGKDYVVQDGDVIVFKFNV